MGMQCGGQHSISADVDAGVEHSLLDVTRQTRKGALEALYRSRPNAHLELICICPDRNGAVIRARDQQITAFAPIHTVNAACSARFRDAVRCRNHIIEHRACIIIIIRRTRGAKEALMPGWHTRVPRRNGAL